eukprot:s587_g10.t1
MATRCWLLFLWLLLVGPSQAALNVGAFGNDDLVKRLRSSIFVETAFLEDACLEQRKLHWTLESVLRQGQSSTVAESAPLLMGEEASQYLALGRNSTSTGLLHFASASLDQRIPLTFSEGLPKNLVATWDGRWIARDCSFAGQLARLPAPEVGDLALAQSSGAVGQQGQLSVSVELAGNDGEVKLHIQLPGGLSVDIRAPAGHSARAADLLRYIALYEPPVTGAASEASFELVSEVGSVRRAVPTRLETRDSILRSFPDCPERLFRESGRLCGSAVSGRDRIQRAWTAGSWAGAVLSARVSSPNRTPTLDLRSRFYAVVSAPGLEEPTIFKSATSYWKLIGNLEESPSISQSFPSELEARVYLEAAGFRDCRIAP